MLGVQQRIHVLGATTLLGYMKGNVCIYNVVANTFIPCPTLYIHLLPFQASIAADMDGEGVGVGADQPDGDIDGDGDGASALPLVLLDNGTLSFAGARDTNGIFMHASHRIVVRFALHAALFFATLALSEDAACMSNENTKKRIGTKKPNN